MIETDRVVDGVGRRARRTPAIYRESLVWSEKPAVWLGLAIGALAVSVPLWIEGFTADKAVGLLAGGALTVSALTMLFHARRVDHSNRRG